MCHALDQRRQDARGGDGVLEYGAHPKRGVRLPVGGAGGVHPTSEPSLVSLGADELVADHAGEGVGP
jgi:hypothetical protein